MSTTSDRAAPVGILIRAPKTAELIATKLRGQIVRGELAAGETLPPEAQLLAEFGVSRPTLREAFRILEAESLIGVRRGSRGGAQVLAPDVDVATRSVGLLLQVNGTTIEDVYQARMVSEPACARLLALRRTDQDLADLRELLDAIAAEVGAGEDDSPDADRWSRLSYRFHELIIQRSGNNTLTLQSAVLQDIVASHVRSRIQDVGARIGRERYQRAIASYGRLIRLVEARDADGAEAHWRAHMEGAAQYLLTDGRRTQSVVDLFD